MSDDNKNVMIKRVIRALADFSSEADKKNPDDHRSYVYALCERTKDNQLIPFYIGEGKDARVWQHELDKNNQIEDIKKSKIEDGTYDESTFSESDEYKELTAKIKKIDEINNKEGSKVEKIIIKWGMTSSEAFMAESALINLLNMKNVRFDSNSDHNLTNIQNGHSSKAEKESNTRTMARTIQEFCNDVALEPLYYEDLQKNKVNAILICINDNYSDCEKITDPEKRNKAIMETCCGCWRLGNYRKADYAFAVDHLRIVGVFRIKKKGNFCNIHPYLDCVNENSEYPNDPDTVEVRKKDFEFASKIKKAADEIGKDINEMTFDDMPSDFQEYYKTTWKMGGKDPYNQFLITKQRKYFVLEDIPETDPHFNEYKGFIGKRVLHNDEYVNIKEEEYQKALAKGKKPKRKVSDAVFAPRNPIRYILDKDKIKDSKTPARKKKRAK